MEVRYDFSKEVDMMWSPREVDVEYDVDFQGAGMDRIGSVGCELFKR